MPGPEHLEGPFLADSPETPTPPFPCSSWQNFSNGPYLSWASGEGSSLGRGQWGNLWPQGTRARGTFSKTIKLPGPSPTPGNQGGLQEEAASFPPSVEQVGCPWVCSIWGPGDVNQMREQRSRCGIGPREANNKQSGPIRHQKEGRLDQTWAALGTSLEVSTAPLRSQQEGPCHLGTQ